MTAKKCIHPCVTFRVLHEKHNVNENVPQITTCKNAQFHQGREY